MDGVSLDSRKQGKNAKGAQKRGRSYWPPKLKEEDLSILFNDYKEKNPDVTDIGELRKARQ